MQRARNEECEHALACVDSVSQDSETGCLARIRTYQSISEHQALALPDTQIDAHKLGESAELIEIIRAWAQLPEPLKAGVLAIIRSMSGGAK